MLILNQVRTNHRLFVVKMLANFIQRGICVGKMSSQVINIYTSAPPKQQSSQP